MFFHELAFALRFLKIFFSTLFANSGLTCQLFFWQLKGSYLLLLGHECAHCTRQGQSNKFSFSLNMHNSIVILNCRQVSNLGFKLSNFLSFMFLFYDIICVYADCSFLHSQRPTRWSRPCIWWPAQVSCLPWLRAASVFSFAVWLLTAPGLSRLF